MSFQIRAYLMAVCLTPICLVVAQPTESVQIPMRDGKTLAADVYLPNDQDSFPTILIMTPYGKVFYAINGLPLGIGKNLSESDYAVVVVDWRCRFASLAACSVNGDNGEDGYDVVEWIATQPWSTGKVGMWGPSALGNVQYETAAERPPHLFCCVPEVAAPHFSYDKYYPGGSLKIETIETLDLLFGIANPIVNNPHYNLIWQIVEDGSMYPDQINVPFLVVGGWYDQNTDQVLRMYDTLRTTSADQARSQHRLLLGPWVHGGTGQAFVGSAIQGELSYPGAAGANVDAALAFFDHHLRGFEETRIDAPVTYFQMGEDQWQTALTWPPAEVEKVNYYLREDGSLQQEKQDPPALLSYVYDPADPSPSVGGKSLNLALDQGPYDQRPQVESREDALIFTTEELDEPLRIQGSIAAQFFIESDRIDTDVAVRITDVYPDGRSMLLIDGIQRMRFREGYRVADTVFMQPGSIYPVRVQLDDVAVTILPGHQLRLIVTGSNYPRHNRNMNNGGPIHPDNQHDTLANPLVALNAIHMSIAYPSHLSLPLAAFSTSNQRQRFRDSTWEIYPNPTEGLLQISKPGESGILSVISSFGQVMKRQMLSAKEIVQVDVSDLVAGVYYFQFRWSGQHKIHKVVLL